MTVTIDIDDRVATALTSQAQAWGLSLEQFLKQIAKNLQPPAVGSADAAGDFDLAMDELFAKDSPAPPGSDSTYSREDIYFERD